MIIKRIVVGKLETNCYILSLNEANLIIDPGANASLIKSNICGSVAGILITHEHADHVGAASELAEYYSCEIYKKSNLCEGVNRIGDFSFNVIYLPGHRSDLIGFYFENENALFSGDFIFRGAIGRVDLDYASSLEMKKSIKKILLYDNMTIYPGHYELTMLDDERDNLSYFVNIL